jgi:hypothetical protein
MVDCYNLCTSSSKLHMCRSYIHTSCWPAYLRIDIQTACWYVPIHPLIRSMCVCVYGPQSLLCTVLWIIHYRGKKLAGYIRWWIYSVNGVSLSLCIYMCKVPKETQGAHSISMSVCVVYVCRTRPSLSQSSCTDEKKGQQEKDKKKITNPGYGLLFQRCSTRSFVTFPLFIIIFFCVCSFIFAI